MRHMHSCWWNSIQSSKNGLKLDSLHILMTMLSDHIELFWAWNCLYTLWEPWSTPIRVQKNRKNKFGSPWEPPEAMKLTLTEYVDLMNGNGTLYTNKQSKLGISTFLVCKTGSTELCSTVDFFEWMLSRWSFSTQRVLKNKNWRKQIGRSTLVKNWLLV